MLTILGLKITYESLAFFTLFLTSEAIGASKLKENSVVQMILTGVSLLKLSRKEDDKIEQIKTVINE